MTEPVIQTYLLLVRLCLTNAQYEDEINLDAFSKPKRIKDIKIITKVLHVEIGLTVEKIYDYYLAFYGFQLDRR